MLFVIGRGGAPCGDSGGGDSGGGEDGSGVAF